MYKHKRINKGGDAERLARKLAVVQVEDLTESEFDKLTGRMDSLRESTGEGLLSRYAWQQARCGCEGAVAELSTWVAATLQRCAAAATHAWRQWVDEATMGSGKIAYKWLREEIGTDADPVGPAG
eukprot:1614456-Amphidinium_carterae.1